MMTPKRIGLLGFDGVTASHLTGAADAFAAAALSDGFGSCIPCYEVWTIGLTAERFQAESGMIFHAQKSLRTAPPLDTIIIPGGKGLRRPEVNERVSDWILKRAALTRRIATICTGIYGLAPTGLLDGREVTTHWRFASDIARRFPKLRVGHKRPFVKDGSFYTSSGLTAGIDLSLALIEEDYGRHVALAVEQELVTYLKRRDVEGEVSKSLAFDSQPTDRFAELVSWIVRNLQEDLSVETLARRACMSPRHFSRAFKSIFGSPPAEFVENLRVNEARRRLSTPRKTLRSVAASVGFTNQHAFHRAFARRFGMKPRHYVAKVKAVPHPAGSAHSAALASANTLSSLLSNGG
jgi:transcriptional regulator GlxA family with amidase domain